MNVLIDLGPHWGHMVTLEQLSQITHIEVMGSNRLRVTCGHETADSKPFQFQSKDPFTTEEIGREKRRLLGMSHGIISKADMSSIIADMVAQTGKSIDVVLDDTQYDIMFVRKIWATLHDQPHFRFTMTYDAENQNVKINESHNDQFMNILPDWLDFRTMQVLDSKDDDLLLMFAYEVLYQMAEPLLPEPEDGAMIDPDANIPTMRGSPMATQQVDLSTPLPTVMSSS